MNKKNTNDSNREHLIEWLRDAHAMEMKAIEILEKQVDGYEEFPEIGKRVRQHLEETKRQSERIERCIEKLDSSYSTTKDIAGKAMGNFAAMANAMASDEIVKNTIADYSFEQFEIACYNSLIEAARVCDEKQVEEVCKENLREEEAMASWIEQQIPNVTRRFLEMELAETTR
jgi:ferritin-like metal-binding protein YciE